MEEITVSHLLDKLSTLLLKEAKLLCQLREELECLKDQLEHMEAFQREIDILEETGRLKAWVKEVRYVAYDIEDVVDYLMPRHLYNRALSDYESVQLILQEAELVGNYQLKKQNTGWPVDEDPQSNVMAILGMLGTGGLRKTTLAQCVYNSAINELKNALIRQHLEEDAKKSVLQRVLYDEFFKISELRKGAIRQHLEEFMKSVVPGVDKMNLSSLISITGIGGMGKTTIRQNLYSKLFEMDELQKGLTKQLFEETRKLDYMDLNCLVGKILAFLPEKRLKGKEELLEQTNRAMNFCSEVHSCDGPKEANQQWTAADNHVSRTLKYCMPCIPFSKAVHPEILSLSYDCEERDREYIITFKTLHEQQKSMLLDNLNDTVSLHIACVADAPHYVDELLSKPKPRFGIQQGSRPSKQSLPEREANQAFLGHEASCRFPLGVLIVFLAASLIQLPYGHPQIFSHSKMQLLVWVMLTFIWVGIISGLSVVLIWLLRMPERQSFLLLLVAILSTTGSYACAIAAFLPHEWLRAPFLSVVFSGIVGYIAVLLKRGKFYSPP